MEDEDTTTSDNVTLMSCVSGKTNTTQARAHLKVRRHFDGAGNASHSREAFNAPSLSTLVFLLLLPSVEHLNYSSNRH